MINCKAFFPEPGKYFINNSLDIECYNDEYNKMILLIFLPGILFYAFAIPILSVTYLKKYMKSNDDAKIMDNMGFLFQGYKQKKFYW